MQSPKGARVFLVTLNVRELEMPIGLGSVFEDLVVSWLGTSSRDNVNDGDLDGSSRVLDNTGQVVSLL